MRYTRQTMTGLRWTSIPAAAVCALLAACGGGPTTPSGAETTITITSSGVSPKEVRVAVGARVTFVNNDMRLHAMTSDPVEVHTDCPAINDVGTLNPGQSKSTGPLTVARVCGFHDHTNEFDDRWKGRIVVQ
jgi:plastocyanin